jgi:hypothetical protein
MASRTRSVIAEMVSFDTLVPYTSARCAAISPVVRPFADSDSTSPSMPAAPSRRR